MRHTIRLITTFMILVILGTAGIARSQTLAETMPGDALVYVGWQGSENLKGAYGQSHLKTFIDASGLREFIEKNAPTMFEKNVAENERENLKAAFSMGGMVWRYPGAIYVGPVDMTDPNHMQPSVAFVCKAGKDAAALKKQIDDSKAKAVKGNDDSDAPKITVEGTADSVIILVGEFSAEARALLTGKAAGGARLSALPAFTAAISQVDKNAAVVAYVDAAGIRKLGLEALAASKDAEAQKRVPAILDALGINELTQMSYSAGFLEKNWEDRMFVGTTGPRKGLFKIFDGKPLDPAVLKLVPKGVTSVSLIRLNLGNVLREVRAVLPKVDERAAEEFERGLAKADVEIKLSIEKDIITPLGDEWLMYRTSRDGDPRMPQGVGVLNKLADAKKAGETVASLEAFMKEQGIPVEKQKIAEVDAWVVNFGPLGFGWAITDGYLVLGLSDELEGAITQIKTKKDGLAEVPEVAAVLKQFGDATKSATVLEYGDPKKPYAMIAKLGTTLIQMYAGRGDVEIPDNLIPEPDKIESALVPGGGIVYSDKAGVHVRSVNGLPGITLLNGQITSSGPGIAIGAAILLPSLGRARELSNRSYDAASLRGISQSCNIWAAENQDLMPEHLAQLVAARQISPKQLVSKNSKTKPAELTEEQLDAAQKDWTTIKKVIEEHSDVVYVGKGLKADTDASQILVFFDPAKVPNAQGMNVGFSDAHAEWIRPGALEETFKAANKTREDAKYPLITIPQMPKKKAAVAPETH